MEGGHAKLATVDAGDEATTRMEEGVRLRKSGRWRLRLVDTAAAERMRWIVAPPPATAWPSLAGCVDGLC